MLFVKSFIFTVVAKHIGSFYLQINTRTENLTLIIDQADRFSRGGIMGFKIGVDDESDGDYLGCHASHRKSAAAIQRESFASTIEAIRLAIRLICLFGANQVIVPIQRHEITVAVNPAQMRIQRVIQPMNSGLIDLAFIPKATSNLACLFGKICPENLGVMIQHILKIGLRFDLCPSDDLFDIIIFDITAGNVEYTER